jgi:hypothetical protein
MKVSDCGLIRLKATKPPCAATASLSSNIKMPGFVRNKSGAHEVAFPENFNDRDFVAEDDDFIMLEEEATNAPCVTDNDTYTYIEGSGQCI